MSSVMTPLNTLLLVFIDLIFHINGQWDVITSDQHLPRPDCVAAVGYWDSKIYILGGVDNPYQFTEYDIATDTYVDKGPDILPYPSNGHSQHYTQINDVIYWITWNTVYSYSITTDTYSQVFVSPTGGGYACLASYQDLILVIGGIVGVPIRNVQVFNTATSVLTAGPSLIDGLRDLTCAVDPIRGVVYAGSGNPSDVRGWLPLIEKLVIGDDIFSASWEYNTESLSYGTWGVRAVYVSASDSIIFVSGDGSTAISRLDCATGQVTKEADLNYECPNTMLIYAENKLYAFGGYNTLDTVQIITNPDMLFDPQTTTQPSTTQTEAVITSTIRDVTTVELREAEVPEQTDDKAKETSDLSTDYKSRSDAPNMILVTLVIGGIVVIITGLCCLLAYKIGLSECMKQKDEALESAAHMAQNVDNAMAANIGSDIAGPQHDLQLNDVRTVGDDTHYNEQKQQRIDLNVDEQILPRNVSRAEGVKAEQGNMDNEAQHSDSSDDMYIMEENADKQPRHDPDRVLIFVTTKKEESDEDDDSVIRYWEYDTSGNAMNNNS